MKSSTVDMPDRRAYSAWPAGSPAEGAREHVVFTPHDRPLSVAFELARDALATHDGVVRVVGRGATVRSAWPEWALTSTRLVVSELDAYRPSDKATLVRPVLASLEEWLRTCFAGTVASPPERALWGSAMNRALHPIVTTWPLVLGICHHHEATEDVILVTDERWIGLAALRARLGARVRTHRTARSAPFALRVAAWGALGAIAAPARRVVEYARERPARAEIARLRATMRGAPTTWVALLGSWPRSCRHVIETMGVAAARRDERVGVLLVQSMAPGVHPLEGAPPSAREAPFPALRSPQLGHRVEAIDQCVAAESAPELARVLARSFVRSARALRRVAMGGARATFGEMPVDLSIVAPGLARLCTLDVLRAVEAEHATRRALERRDFRGAKVVFPHASLANMAVPDLALRAAGAETFDVVHGSLYDPLDLVTFERTWSGVKVFWTEAEAQFYGEHLPAQRCVGGYVPRPIELRSTPRARSRGEPIRVLAVTNYLCNNDPEDRARSALESGPLARESAQAPFLDALESALARLDARVSIRWRPHPYDQRARVHATHAAYARLGMELSLEKGALPVDLAWADVVVSSVSTSLLEALVFAVPIFVHEIPVHEPRGVLSFIAPERRFRDGASLRPLLETCIAALERGEDVLAPERATRRLFFGESCRPRLHEDLFWPAAKANGAHPPRANGSSGLLRDVGVDLRQVGRSAK